MCFDSRHWTPFDSICTTSPPSLQDTFKIPNTPAIPSDRFFHPLSSFSHIQCSIQQLVCHSMSLFWTQSSIAREEVSDILNA